MNEARQLARNPPFRGPTAPDDALPAACLAYIASTCLMLVRSDELRQRRVPITDEGNLLSC